MEKIIINGGLPLNGDVYIDGMKNAALPIIAATLLCGDTCIINNVPAVSDISMLLEIIAGMGATVEYLDKSSIRINTANVKPGCSPFQLVSKIRGSAYIIGAEIGRFGTAHVGYPGGCDFGVRPLDLHMKGFEALGAKITIESGYINAVSPMGLHGNSIYLRVASVGATVNCILASVFAEGVTTIEGAAQEPHIVDMANFLNACGANITGAGTPSIKIRGVKALKGCTYTIIPDMIEAGTYMAAAAITGGRVCVRNVIPKHMEATSAVLQRMGVKLEIGADSITVLGDGKLLATDVTTMPYPGFPTDMHPQISALMCVADGVSRMSEHVWDNRFRYINEFQKMGTEISVSDKTASFSGSSDLSGAPVVATDLRAGAAMIILALRARGTSEISKISLIERGYDNIVGKLAALGADIQKIEAED